MTTNRLLSKEDNRSSYAFYRLEQVHEDVRDGSTEDVAVVKARVEAQRFSKYKGPGIRKVIQKM